MTGNISSEFNRLGLNQDIRNVSMKAVGVNLMPQEENPFDGMSLMLGIGGVMEAGKGIGWLWSASKNPIPEGLSGDELKAAKKAASPFKNGWGTAMNNIKGGWAKYSKGAQAKIDGLNLVGGKDQGLLSGDFRKTVLAQHDEKIILDRTAGKLAKLKALDADKVTEKTTKAIKDYEAAQKAAKYSVEQAVSNPGRAKEALKIANRRLACADALAHGEVKATGFFGKLFEGLGKITGFSKANGALKTLATKSPRTAKILKLGKGNGIILGITAAMELFTQVIPTFAQLGFEKGLKQLGKSTVKTAASIGGWIAGEAVGAAGGALLGAEIGALGGPIGLAVGGVVGGICGMIGGCLGSWMATRAAKVLTGDDELEKAKKEQGDEIAKQASKDPEALKKVMAMAAQKMQEEGVNTPENQIAFGSLNRLAKSVQAAPADNTAVSKNTPQENPTGQTQTTPQTQTQNPTFNGLGLYNTNPLAQLANPLAGQTTSNNNLFANGASNPLMMQAMMNKKFGQQDMMNQDFMAASVGLG